MIQLWSTDRKAFYYQCKVSAERAATNACTPALKPEALRGALDDVESHLRADGGRPPALVVAPPEAKRAVEFHGCLGALAMGDHNAVEWAQEGHRIVLRRGGLLSEERLLHGHRPLPRSDVYEGLCIDDYFLVDVKAEAEGGLATELFSRAQA